MKIFISKWIVALLFVVIGAIAVFYVYNGHYLPILEENEKLEQQIKLYEKNLQNLAQHKLNEETYKSETEKAKKEVEELLAKFPVEIRLEDELLYVDYLEEKLKYSIGTLNVGAEYSIYSMANGKTLCAQYITVPYTTTYKGFKELVTFFNGDNKTDDEYPASIVQISVSYNPQTDTMSGAMIIRRYYVTGNGGYVPPVIPDGMFEIGNDNILK